MKGLAVACLGLCRFSCCCCGGMPLSGDDMYTGAYECDFTP